MSDTAFSVRRIITGHGADGRSAIIEDAPVAAEALRIEKAIGGKNVFTAEVWGTGQMPPSNSDEFLAQQKAGARKLPRETIGSRTTLRFMVLPPHSVSPMHRTETLDYGILLEGECDVLLENGDRASCAAGDVVIQRGTIHSWINVSDSSCRWAWVLIDSPPVEINGVALRQEWRDAPEI